MVELIYCDPSDLKDVAGCFDKASGSFSQSRVGFIQQQSPSFGLLLQTLSGPYETARTSTISYLENMQQMMARLSQALRDTSTTMENTEEGIITTITQCGQTIINGDVNVTINNNYGGSGGSGGSGGYGGGTTYTGSPTQYSNSGTIDSSVSSTVDNSQNTQSSQTNTTNNSNTEQQYISVDAVSAPSSYTATTNQYAAASTHTQQSTQTTQNTTEQTTQSASQMSQSTTQQSYSTQTNAESAYLQWFKQMHERHNTAQATGQYIDPSLAGTSSSTLQRDDMTTIGIDTDGNSSDDFSLNIINSQTHASVLSDGSIQLTRDDASMPMPQNAQYDSDAVFTLDTNHDGTSDVQLNPQQGEDMRISVFEDERSQYAAIDFDNDGDYEAVVRTDASTAAYERMEAEAEARVWQRLADRDPLGRSASELQQLYAERDEFEMPEPSYITL